MARVEASLPIDMINLEAYYGQVLKATSTEIIISDGVNSSVYRGRGFTYSDEDLTGGTLTEYHQYYGSSPVASVYGLSVPATLAYVYIQSNNLAALLEIALSQSDIIVGSPYADDLAGYAGDDIIFGGDGDDSIYGGAGNDVLSGQAGNNYIHGGTGFDHAEYAGSAASYEYRVLGNGAVEVRDLFGQQYDYLVSIERLLFDDGVIAFDVSGNAGQAYRLYQAAFDRTPDPAGLGYWIKSLDAGIVDLKAAANYFVLSEEFASLYGRPDEVSNADFINLLYLNILDRPAEGEGFDFWLGEMNAGKVEKDDVLAYFSESDENIAKVGEAIEGGIWFA